MNQSNPQHNELTHIVRKLPMRQRVAALGDALLVAPIHERDEHAYMLIEIAGFASPHTSSQRALGPIELITRFSGRVRARFSDEALLALARAWMQLSPSVRDVAAGLGRQRWVEAAQILKGEAVTGSRLAAIAIAHDTADPGFGPLVCELLCDEQQSVRAAADKALLRLTVTMLEHLPRAMLGDELAQLASQSRVTLHADPAVIELERCTLFGAIADAAWSFSSHRCRSPLLASLLLMDRAAQTPMEHAASNRMRRLLAQRQHPSHSPMRTVLRRSAVPILRERALRWIVIGPIASATSDRLMASDTIEEHQVVLNQATLGARPKRAERLRALRHSARTIGGQLKVDDNGFLPAPRVFSMLPESSRVGALRLIGYAVPDEQTRLLYIDAALGDDSAYVRAHASALASGADLVDFMYDQSEPIARSAALRWSSVGIQPTMFGKPAWAGRHKVAQTNQRSASAWVRRIAREECDRLAPWNLHSPVSRVHARRLFASDPAAFVRSLRDRIANNTTCCEALMLIRELGIETRFELDLIGLIQDNHADARTLATAVGALGRVNTDAARRIVRDAINHADDRVRANAVETIHEPAGEILEIKDDPSHRVRANVLRRVITSGTPRAPLDARGAGEALIAMLDDAREEHRLAGAWAAQRTMIASARPVLGSIWKPLVERISHLAVDEKNERIRMRASQCTRRLLAELDEHTPVQPYQGGRIG